MLKLTSAEWKIMRVIWERQPIDATTIAHELYTFEKWRLTTVKTLLSRLVEKKLISIEIQGKKYIYRAVWTERDCVISEMQQALHRIYGGQLHLKTKRFSFYGVKNDSLISKLSIFLENETNRIERRYPIILQPTQEIFLYSSKEKMHSALGLINAPDWLRAAWVWDILHLAPEETFDNISIEAATLLVWMQKILSSMNPSASYWLVQGIATYESGLIQPSRLKNTILNLLPSLHPSSVLQLSTEYSLFKLQSGYELTSLAVQFIIEKFGLEKLILLINSPYDFEKWFQMSETAFWDLWFQYTVSRFSEKEK